LATHFATQRAYVGLLCVASAREGSRQAGSFASSDSIGGHKLLFQVETFQRDLDALSMSLWTAAVACYSTLVAADGGASAEEVGLAAKVIATRAAYEAFGLRGVGLGPQMMGARGTLTPILS